MEVLSFEEFLNEDLNSGLNDDFDFDQDIFENDDFDEDLDDILSELSDYNDDEDYLFEIDKADEDGDDDVNNFEDEEEDDFEFDSNMGLEKGNSPYSIQEFMQVRKVVEGLNDPFLESFFVGAHDFRSLKEDFVDMGMIAYRIQAAERRVEEGLVFESEDRFFMIDEESIYEKLSNDFDQLYEAAEGSPGSRPAGSTMGDKSFARAKTSAAGAGKKAGVFTKIKNFGAGIAKKVKRFGSKIANSKVGKFVRGASAKLGLRGSEKKLQMRLVTLRKKAGMAETPEQKMKIKEQMQEVNNKLMELRKKKKEKEMQKKRRGPVSPGGPIR